MKESTIASIFGIIGLILIGVIVTGLSISIDKSHTSSCNQLLNLPSSYNDTITKKFDGLYMHERNYTHPGAIQAAKNYDPYGNWVCVNVDSMSYERAMEVCRHETFHEIFAVCGESNNVSDCVNQFEEGRNHEIL